MADVLDGTSYTCSWASAITEQDVFRTWFAGCGQYSPDLPDGENQRGSADVVLGTRELNRAQRIPEMDVCPAARTIFSRRA